MITFKRLCLAALLFVPLAAGTFPPNNALAQVQGSSYVEPSGTMIRDIQVVGTERIEPATVLTYLDIKVGDPMTQETLDSALKSLFGTGLFADVSLRQKGSTLEVTVVENPVINEIAFEGNDKIKDDELLAEIQLRPRQVFTRTKVQTDTTRLYQVYRRNGRFAVNIEPKVIKLDQNRVNLVFEVDEGPVTYVKSVKFVGNTHFSDNKLLSEISTAETRWYKFLSTDDRYDPDRLAYDQELLRRFYMSEGYADFRVISATAELSKDKDYFYVTFTVEEGDRYRVGNVRVAADLRDFDENALVPFLKIQPGEWYNADKVQETVDAFTEALADMNQNFVSVRPDIERNREKKTVELSFSVVETQKQFVERIDIQGNVRTMDKVIRREMQLVEGDAFNKEKLAKSEQNIKDLGFFENVRVSSQQGSAPDKKVIDIGVEEKSTGELSIGAGFSTADGPLADFRVRERNLLGKGQDLLFATTIAGERTEFDLSFTEPYFLDRDLMAGFSLFHMTRDLHDESSYAQRRTGGSLQMGYPLSENLRQTLNYRLERNDIEDVDPDASRFILDQEGKRVTSAISQTLAYDTRDSKLITTKGTYAWLNTEFAGLGGDAEYLSGKLGASYFYPVYEDQVILSVLGETGAIGGLSGKDVKINERYFLGGTSLRGFETSGIGPRDTLTDDALGGNLFYRGSVEMAFPIGLPEEMGIQGHAFTDFGSLWDLDETGTDIVDNNSLRAAGGVGVSWRSPMGPVRVDLATPYLSEDFDKEENFRFSFGTRF
ncbi:MAG: outer membrane protein assembly factor BamA [Micavibrio aeruginosavorus]|nr:outer membrane protein assembly factor BamA [Micavibrio aeruginosavorus]